MARSGVRSKIVENSDSCNQLSIASVNWITITLVLHVLFKTVFQKIWIIR